MGGLGNGSGRPDTLYDKKKIIYVDYDCKKYTNFLKVSYKIIYEVFID